MQEKRSFRRVPLGGPVLVDTGSQTYTVEGRNISAGGMLVKAEHTEEEGRILRLEFCLPGDPRPFRVRGTVQHVSPGAFMGIQFSGLTETDRSRIEDFVKAAK
jgi:hypothetical protein